MQRTAQRSCSTSSTASSTSSSYGLDPGIDEIMATMDLGDLDIGISEETLMRSNLAIYAPESIELFLPLFMSLDPDDRAIYLFNKKVFEEAVKRAQIVFRSQGRSPVSTTPATPRPSSSSSSSSQASGPLTPTPSSSRL